MKNLTFQYNICFGSTCFLSCFCFFITYISIQHLFRFDLVKSLSLASNMKFQYNICFGSTLLSKPLEMPTEEFQYNICFGSTKVNLFKYCSIVSFQYNICFGSTKKGVKKWINYRNFNTTFVSVRLKPYR